MSRFPTDIGITSEVINSKKVYWTNKGYKDPKFNQITDNASNGPKIKNIVALPLFSKPGILSWIIHFINKEDGLITKATVVFFIIG